MALVSSGEISIGGSTAGRSIALEFGRSATAQLALSQLYRGGGIVPTNNTPVPTSGAISLSNFYGAVNRLAYTITYAASTTNASITTGSIPGYVSGGTDLTVNVNSGVTIGAGSGTTPAMVISGFSTGDTININNAGTLLGGGGPGGGSTYGSVNGRAGTHALDISGVGAAIVAVTNTGTMAGGGGGGGSGRSAFVGPYPSGYSFATDYTRGGGGGGGAGTNAGAAGGIAPGPIGPGPSRYYGTASGGSAGTATTGGARGSQDYGHWSGVSPNTYFRGGVGGNGGARGAAGQAGEQAYYGGDDIGQGVLPNGPFWFTASGTASPLGSGGAAGNYINGVSKLRTPFTNSGTLFGPAV